ncbi:MAG: taurine ABC transporter substrate-binding protein [Acidiferrobacterales bacterium]
MKNLVKSIGCFLVLPLVLVVTGIGTSLAAKEVTIGYQLIYNPWKVAIADGKFEKATGYKIDWRKFNSGSKVINAMASGDVQIALAGSSPIAAGVSRGIDMKLFWIVEDIASAEAFVVRNGSGIAAPQDLKGKKIGVPFVSTTHFHLLFALEQFGIDPKEVTILNMQPNQIAAAWSRGDIDAAFVWDPALGRIKESGKVLITSGQLCQWGKCTFDGMVVNSKWAEQNKDFMAKFIGVIAKADEAYRSNPMAWTPDSPMVKKIVKMVGGNPKDVPGVLALYGFPNLKQQASRAWLGGGKDGGAARALMFTSQFLKNEKKIPSLQSNYGKFVTDEYVKEAMKMQ